ncbi:C40 family peptidase [Streptomyces drozdowiczii]|uniref:NlpC/P60 family protein n=1 Tax=Streptomyces drozdowiczii TaxID=202862 RepID=A0ABY6PV38_9ACTN|nr:C40 family peptidase [Streptomyces drozdowiczii]MCX0244611.1 NlpC/P60 family protein [Streptomyces drozdowiczii]UZK55641.1 NlpC/P60 family protein [Streptomyces drozdowiczii]
MSTATKPKPTSSAGTSEPMSSGKKWAIGLVIAGLLPWLFFILAMFIGTGLLPGGGASLHQDPVPTQTSCVEVAGIPKPTCEAYLSAEQKIKKVRPKCKNLKWTLLAGIGKIESHHGTFMGRKVNDKPGASYGDVEPPVIGPVLDGTHNTQRIPDTDGGKYDNDTTYDRAVGPTQFIPQTWESVAQDGDDDGDTDPQNVFDSALSTAALLCGKNSVDMSDPTTEHDAIYRYNHSEQYVKDVRNAKAEYDALGDITEPVNATGDAKKIIAAAKSQKGVPYSWGGGDTLGPSYGICCSPGGYSGRFIKGFDCSGLTEYAYGKAGIMIGGTAQAQHDSGKVRVTHQTNLKGAEPGDLLFFSDNPGSGKGIFHVSIYLGGNRQIEAPRTNDVVKESDVRMGSLDSIGHLK